MYKCFKRKVWQKNPDWPQGYEPFAHSVVKCRTLASFETWEEARDWCQERNAKWRQYHDRVTFESFKYDPDLQQDPQRLNPRQLKIYFEAPRYEWTEE